MDSEGNYIEISSMRASQKYVPIRDRIHGAYDVGGESVQYVDKEVCYLNYYIRQWGHYLIDVIGRLWYMAGRQIPLVYTVCEDENFEIDGSYLEFLQLFGISSDRLLKVCKPTRFRRIIVPESSICPGGYYTKEYTAIFDQVVGNALKGCDSESIGKVYCSRGQLKKAAMSEIGEEWIEKFFIDQGYHSICFEKKSLREQIKIINCCGEMAMLSGSLQHNLLFARRKLSVTVLMKSCSHSILIHMVNQISGAAVCSVDAYLYPLPVTTDGPFWFYPSRQFVRYCRDKGMFWDNNDRHKRILKKKNIVYLYKYLRINWKRLLRGTIYTECPYRFRDIRNQYRAVLQGRD